MNLDPDDFAYADEMAHAAMDPEGRDGSGYSTRDGDEGFVPRDPPATGRFSAEYIQTLRERMRTDITHTLFARTTVDLEMTREQMDDLLDALVEDGMHPLEKIVADIRHEDIILGRNR